MDSKCNLSVAESDVCPSCGARVSLDATKCEKCGALLVPAPRLEDAEEIRLADLRAELIDKIVKVKVQIVGVSDKMALPDEVYAICNQCDEVLTHFSMGDPRHYKSLGIRIFKGERAFEARLKDLYGRAGNCNCKRKKVIIDYEGYIDYRVAYVRDLLTEKEKWDERTYRVYDIHLIECRVPTSHHVEVTGVATVDEKDRIVIVGYAIKPLENPHPHNFEWDVQSFERYFRDNPNLTEDIDGTIANHIVGRPLAKIGAALVLHSPVKIMFEGRRVIRGSLWALFVGDTTVGKSEILEWIWREVGGEFGIGEQSRRTGIVFTVDMERKVIIWGLLVQADMGLALIDSLQGMDPDEIPSLREVQRQQRVKVEMAVRGEALARTRVLAAANPQRDLSNYRYPVECLRDIRCIPDIVDLTRWDLFVPFKEDDVDAKRIAEAHIKTPSIPVEVFREHVLWAWTLKPEDIIFTDEAVKAIRETFVGYKDLMLSQLPVVHRGFKETIARISAACAVLRHNVNAEGKVEVTCEHVDMSHTLIDRILESFEYPVFVESRRMMVDVTDEELKELQGLLTGKMLVMLNIIGDNPGIQSSVLEKMLGVETRTIRNYAATLKGRNLIQSARGRGGGYELSPKGIQVLKRLLSKSTSTLQEKIEMILNTIQRLQGDRGVSKARVADELQEKLPRREVLLLIEKLIDEGKVIRVDLEHVRKN